MNNVSASTVLMVPPEHFAYNPQTAQSNAYQKDLKQQGLQEQAMAEYEQMVAILREHGITVLEMHQKKSLPDAVFPNNWFSTRLNNQGETDVFLYPMYTENRQQEVNPQGLIELLKSHQVDIASMTDLRQNNSGILEGTGSLVIDHANQRLYAALSPRTDEKMVQNLAEQWNYAAIVFDSVDEQQQAIYHTNVMMSIAKDYAIVCLESIVDSAQRQNLIEHIEQTGKLLIPISYQQVNHMCGNTLELTNLDNERFLVMSMQAYQHFEPEQCQQIECFSTILPVDISTIETVGGGSARCMMAEIFHR